MPSGPGVQIQAPTGLEDLAGHIVADQAWQALGGGDQARQVNPGVKAHKLQCVHDFFAAHIARVEYKKDLLLTCLAFLSAALAWVPLAFLLRRLYVLEEAEEKQFSENYQEWLKRDGENN